MILTKRNSSWNMKGFPMLSLKCMESEFILLKPTDQYSFKQMMLTGLLKFSTCRFHFVNNCSG